MPQSAGLTVVCDLILPPFSSSAGNTLTIPVAVDIRGTNFTSLTVVAASDYALAWSTAQTSATLPTDAVSTCSSASATCASDSVCLLTCTAATCNSGFCMSASGMASSLSHTCRTQLIL